MAFSEESERLMLYGLIACCVCCALIVLINVLLQSGLLIAWITRDNRNKNAEDSRKTDVKPAKAQRFISSNTPRNYMGAQEYCARYNKYLPHPQSQKAENRIIEDIKISNIANCRYVFFAYVANANVRYQSSISDVIWPSLKLIKDGSIPFRYTKCYVLAARPGRKPRIISHKQCGNVAVRNLLVLTTFSNYCRQHRFACVDVYESLSGGKVPLNFLKAKKIDSTLTLLPYDKNMFPENLRLVRLSRYSPFVAMATKYYFRYEFGKFEQKYNSIRFTVIDPEYDCLAYDTVRDLIVTRSCDTRGCPICY